MYKHVCTTVCRVQNVQKGQKPHCLGMFEAQGGNGVLVMMFGPGPLSNCSRGVSLLDCAVPINQLPL